MGKGDNRRPTFIDDARFTNNWCASFGHKTREGSKVCINCGQRVTRKRESNERTRSNQDVD